MYDTNTNDIGRAGSALRMPEPETRQGEISVEFEMLHKASEELRLNIGELESRLSPILAPSMPEASGSENKSAPEPVRTPLAETIHQRCVDIYSFNVRLRYLLNGIEL